MSTTDIRARFESEIPHLRRYAQALTRDAVNADDLVQDCLERAWSRIDQFQTGTELRRWLFTIMRNLHIDDRRRHARRGPHVPVEEWFHEMHRAPSQETYLELRDVERRIGELREGERDVVMLSVFGGLQHEAIAARMDIAVGTVKSRLSRARRVLAA